MDFSQAPPILGSAAQVDSAVTGWDFALHSGNDIFLRSTSNSSQLYHYCEAAAASCHGQARAMCNMHGL